MEFLIGPLILIIIVLIFWGIRYIVENEKEQLTGTKGVTMYYFVINIIIFLLINRILEEIIDEMGLNSSYNSYSKEVLIFFGFMIAAAWTLIMLVSFVIELAILIPFILICNLAFYELYLKKISLIKDKSISNLKLFWKITTPLAILLIIYLHSEIIGILLIFIIQYFIFSLVIKNRLMYKIHKMRDFGTLS